jgi:hypothetical protein
VLFLCCILHEPRTDQRCSGVASHVLVPASAAGTPTAASWVHACVQGVLAAAHPSSRYCQRCRRCFPCSSRSCSRRDPSRHTPCTCRCLRGQARSWGSMGPHWPLRLHAACGLHVDFRTVSTGCTLLQPPVNESRASSTGIPGIQKWSGQTFEPVSTISQCRQLTSKGSCDTLSAAGRTTEACRARNSTG